ncbi:uncharacterized protein [Triticum aestivum]|uniref:uncharacterized protein n=1 Tax=Triticum aestivum TaxID=4565 RepID=UPI001D022C98|nr:uncharacterized protein LOC123082987 [Triticum aestivum]
MKKLTSFREYQREMEVVLHDQSTSVDEPMHEKGRRSIRHIIKHIAAEHRKAEEDADMHAANITMQQNQHCDMSRRVDDKYDDSVHAPTRKSGDAGEENNSTNRHILTQKERCMYCFGNPSRPNHLVVAVGNLT